MKQLQVPSRKYPSARMVGMREWLKEWCERLYLQDHQHPLSVKLSVQAFSRHPASKMPELMLNIHPTGTRKVQT